MRDIYLIQDVNGVLHILVNEKPYGGWGYMWTSLGTFRLGSWLIGPSKGSPPVTPPVGQVSEMVRSQPRHIPTGCIAFQCGRPGMRTPDTLVTLWKWLNFSSSVDVNQPSMSYAYHRWVWICGPTQHFWRKTLVSTLRSFFKTPIILTPDQPPKFTNCSLYQLPLSNTMVSIRSWGEMWLHLYMGIPYLLNVREWGWTFLMT